MDYEKAYKEALERARGIHSFSSDIAEIKRMEQIFPELAESENERIRKVQLDYWRSVGGKEWHGVPVQETIAWLEKQGKKPPVLSNSLNIGKDLQIDGFDAELNALLKKYEHLPYDETIECLKYYVGVLVNMRNKAMEEQE